MSSQTHSELPVIDFSTEKLKGGTSFWLSLSNKVCDALEEYGCFVALYDKVSPELRDSIFSVSKELFDLPMETKVKNKSNTMFGFGYESGYTTMPLFEHFGIENGATPEATQKFSDLMWPDGNDTFCETALSFSKVLAELSQVVLHLVFDKYGVEKYYESHIDSLVYLMKFLKYRAPMNNEYNTGLNRHTDKNFMTILDRNQTEGLEFQTKDGEWIKFKPLPSAFIVIGGDGLMAWSNGRTHSPFHRVNIKGNEDRYTLALFALKHHGMVETPEELIDDEHPLQFKPFNHYEYIQYCCGEEGMMLDNTMKVFCGV